MTIGPRPLCMDCKHFHREDTGEYGLTCDAFPDGIPEEIIWTGVEHRKPYPGDHGIQFELMRLMEPIPRPTPEQVRAYDKALANRLRELRLERGLKRLWVAEQMGIHYSTIRNWEQAVSRPATVHLLYPAAIYDIEPDAFYQGIT